VLSNSAICGKGTPEEIAHKAILIADAIMKEMHGGDHHITSPHFPKQMLPPPVPSSWDGPPTRPHTPTSITRDRMEAISGSLGVARYSFFDLPPDELG